MPLQFNIFLEILMSTALLDVGVVLSGHVVNSLRFADDFAAVAENNHDLQLIVDKIAADSTRM